MKLTTLSLLVTLTSLSGCSARVEHLVLGEINSRAGFRSANFHRPTTPVCHRESLSQGIKVFATHRTSQYPSLMSSGLIVDINETKTIAPWKQLESIELDPGNYDVRLNYNLGINSRTDRLSLNITKGKWYFVEYRMPALIFNRAAIYYSEMEACD